MLDLADNKSGTYTRSQTMPIVDVEAIDADHLAAKKAHKKGVVITDDMVRHQAWNRLWASLRHGWRQTSQAATWLAVEFAKIDNEPLLEGKKRLPKLNAPNATINRLRRQAREQWPDIDSQTFYGVARNVQKRVLGSKSRFARRILCSDSIPKFCYPQPLPVQTKDYKLTEADNGSFWFEFRVLTGQRIRVRIGGGPPFARQMNAVRLALSSGKLGAASVFLKRSCNKPMVAIATSLPLPTKRVGRAMNVGTHPVAFLTAELEGRQVWVLNADHLRRQEESHRVFLERFRQDTKYEHRWDRQTRRNMGRAMETRCQKNKDRRQDYVKKAAANLVNFALRNGVATILYQDVCRDYLKQFCWFEVAIAIASKCESESIEFIHVNKGEEGE